MFKRLLLRFRYGNYLRNEHGIKKFAEMSMGQLIRKATKKSAFYREMNENLLVEKANLRMRRDELYEKPTLESSHFFSVRRELWANTFMVVFIIAAAIFLNVVAAQTFIDEATILGATLSWIASVLLAIVLTGSGVLIAERLINVLMKRRNDDEHRVRSRMVLVTLWGSLLAGIEIAILGIAEVQASNITAQGGSALLFVGYMLASALLPVIAGAFRWHSMRHIDRYKTTRVVRQIESRLAQIESVLRQNDEYESNFYKIKSIEYWDQVNEFKTLKDNVNQKRGVVEQLGGHFAQNYDQFQAEANKRYTQDIRDITTKSLRKLELVDTESKVGAKIGQDGGEGTDQRGQVASDHAKPPKRNGNASSGTIAEYMSLKPVR